jgi:hypothetical protein
MRVFRESLLLLLLALTAVPAAQGVSIDEPGVFNIRVHLQADRSIRSRFAIADLEEETATLWRPYGVHIEWADVNADNAAPCGFPVEAILEAKSGIRVDPNGAMILGRATVRLGSPTTQPIHVLVDATEQFLTARRDAPTVRLASKRELSRALGRVLAHELGHVLLGPYGHDATGLMRAAFFPDDLAAPSRTAFRLSEDGVGRLRWRIHVLAGMSDERIH